MVHDTTGNKSVDLMRDFRFPNEVIVKPKAWNYTIVNNNGKTQRLAMDILAMIVYWYRPAKGNGINPKGHKRFWNGKYQKTVADLVEEFNENDKTIRRALNFLEKDIGVIQKSTENIRTNKGKICSNVLYIELNVERLIELTYPKETERTKLSIRGTG